MLTESIYAKIKIGKIILKDIEYEVGYVELENDEKPFEKFILSLTLKERAKIFETINYFLELKNKGSSKFCVGKISQIW